MSKYRICIFYVDDLSNPFNEYLTLSLALGPSREQGTPVVSYSHDVIISPDRKEAWKCNDQDIESMVQIKWEKVNTKQREWIGNVQSKFREFIHSFVHFTHPECVCACHGALRLSDETKQTS